MDNEHEWNARKGFQSSISAGTTALNHVLNAPDEVMHWIDTIRKPMLYDSLEYKDRQVKLAREQQIQPIMDKMVSSITKFEGFIPPGGIDGKGNKYPAGSTSFRNNNPGNLKFAGQPGAEKDEETGFAMFKTKKDGEHALAAQIRAAVDGKSSVFHPEMSLEEFFKAYAPSKDHNHPVDYARFVASQINTSTDKSLKQIFYGE